MLFLKRISFFLVVLALCSCSKDNAKPAAQPAKPQAQPERPFPQYAEFAQVYTGKLHGWGSCKYYSRNKEYSDYEKFDWETGFENKIEDGWSVFRVGKSQIVVAALASKGRHYVERFLPTALSLKNEAVFSGSEKVGTFQNGLLSVAFAQGSRFVELKIQQERNGELQWEQTVTNKWDRKDCGATIKGILQPFDASVESRFTMGSDVYMADSEALSCESLESAQLASGARLPDGLKCVNKKGHILASSYASSGGYNHRYWFNEAKKKVLFFSPKPVLAGPKNSGIGEYIYDPDRPAHLEGANPMAVGAMAELEALGVAEFLPREARSAPVWVADENRKLLHYYWGGRVTPPDPAVPAIHLFYGDTPYFGRD